MAIALGNVAYCSYVIHDDTVPASPVSTTPDAASLDAVSLVGVSPVAASPMAVPDPGNATMVLPAPGTGAGAWAGSPSAVRVGGEIFLAYRLRTADSRGYAVGVARSADGVRLKPLVTITKDQMETESLERPALAVTPDGSWRLYLSCATAGTKHWRVELIEAAAPDAFDPQTRQVLLPGDSASAVKDPVVLRHGGRWHLWASVHPLTDPDHTDRMTTEYASSTDGLDWTWHGPALAPRPGEWDARGVRVAHVRAGGDGFTAYYDGRATAAQNCEELTGIAVGSTPDVLTAVGQAPIARSPQPGGGLRYLTVVDLGNGFKRIYYELTNANGSHDLVTELQPSPANN